MDTIHNLKISKMFPTAVYLRGLSYYQNDQVSDLLYDMNNDIWTANVHGSKMYFVEINFGNVASGTIEAYCDCPAFATYDSCKHIVAVLLSISDRPTPDPTMNDTMADRFIESITEGQQRDYSFFANKVPMHVEYYCSWDYERNLQLELKTGENRIYVIRNVYDFLKNVLSGNEHFFTKAFTYRPDRHYFLQQDLHIFELLLAILNNEKMYEFGQYNSYRTKAQRERYMIIPLLSGKNLLEKLIDRDFTVQVDKETYEQVAVVTDELPFEFSLTSGDEDQLILQFHNVKQATYFPHYEMLFIDGTFYFPKKEQLPVIKHVTQFGMKDFRLPISSSQTNTFLSEVLPSLEKVGKVNVAEHVEQNIVQFPLQAQLYLELKENWIVGKLVYRYGENEIDPFNHQALNEQMIVRDAEKEQKIMSLIEYTNFHYNGKELYIEVEDEEHLYEFLYTILPVLDEHVDLFLTSEVRNFIVDHEPIPSTNVRIESSTNFLEIGFDIEGVNEDEIQALLNAVIEKKRYYRMRSGALLSLEGEEFSSMKQLFSDLNIEENDLHDGTISMPAYRGTQIDELIQMEKNYDPSFEKLLQHLRSPEQQVYELPENLHATLRNYQKTGYQWFKSLSEYHLGGILADDMGLGKTIQTIAYILSEPSEHPHLIIVPSSVVYNWKNECHRFAPDLQVTVIQGTPEERQAIIAESGDVDVWITSYATARQDIAQYRSLTFQTLILDEAQYIKNYATKTSQAIRQIKATRRFALSGTPIENSIDELWAIFQVVLPGLMPNQREFKQLSHEKIAQLTKPFILRRIKEDVLTELPDKIESLHVSDLTKEQKELYVGYLQRLQQETSESLREGGFHQNRMKILAGLTRLRQICCHPSLFIENYHGGSGKLEQLLDTIDTSLANGKRLLIFSQFTSMHAIIIEQLEKKGIDFFYLQGSTPSEERVEMSERFNNGEKDIFLISLRAGGTGLNLTGADTVILYDLWWNPAVEDQATGRAHRFGQKNVVQVIRLVTEGTIEEKIYELQQKKRELIDQVIQPGETMLSSLSEEDIRELLSL